MASAAYIRRDYSGIAVETTLNGGINASIESFAITDATGWPTGANGPFFAQLESEIIDCLSRTATTITVVSGGRGANGTTAATHSSGVAAKYVSTAYEANEANLAVAKTVGLATAAGQIPVVDAANSFAMVQAKTSGQVLVGNGTTVASVAVSGDVTINSSGVTAIGSGKVTSGMILDGTIATGDIADSAITSAKIADGTIAAADIASDAVTTAKILNANVTTAKIADANITTAKFAAGAVDATALGTGAVTSAKILDGTIATADIAALAVDSTLLAANAVTTAKITAANVTGPKLEAALPRGLLAAPVSVTSDQGSISTSYVDLTSLTRTVTPETATRYIEVEGWAEFTSGTADDEIIFAIREGSTVITTTSATHVSGSAYTGVRVKFTIIDPTLAAHTYKLSAKLGTGTGPFTMKAAVGMEAWLTVKDTGGH